jgi:hypothetical protein
VSSGWYETHFIAEPGDGEEAKAAWALDQDCEVEFTQRCEFSGIPVFEMPRDLRPMCVPCRRTNVAFHNQRMPSCRTSLQKASIAAI